MSRKVEVRPLRLSDLTAVADHPHYPGAGAMIQRTAGVRLFQGGAWTLLLDGRPVVCVGVLGGNIWAIVDPAVPPLMRGVRHLRRLLRRFQEEHGAIRAQIDTTYPPAVRCAKLVGLHPTEGVEYGYPVWRLD